MKHYHLSAKGRRTTLVLLISALAIWGFALWSFSSTLELGSNPLGFWAALNTGTEEGIEMSRLVPAFLMLVLIVATPLLMWNLLEEWAAAYTPTDEGLRFTSLGVHILYPWESIQDIRRLDDDSDEPVEELLLSTDETSQIRNPVLRFLHAQAYGRTRLPLYAGLEEREALLAEIRQRAGLTPAVDEAQPAAS